MSRPVLKPAMRAVLARGPRTGFSLSAVHPVPHLEGAMARIKVAAVGICASDAKMFDSSTEFLLGPGTWARGGFAIVPEQRTRGKCVRVCSMPRIAVADTGHRDDGGGEEEWGPPHPPPPHPANTPTAPPCSLPGARPRVLRRGGRRGRRCNLCGRPAATHPLTP
ncbi:hypothetical protein T492DRAFT_230666 [Pavlovales sp. CCMP2436]|nr:hypothetical protein T492DRAFT_230666 [Pavlovales sp. CCMP2436]